VVRETTILLALDVALLVLLSLGARLAAGDLLLGHLALALLVLTMVVVVHDRYRPEHLARTWEE
jgi:hypothetical protein